MSENDDNLIQRYHYRINLQEAQGSDVKTIDAVMRAIAEFEEFVAAKDFAKLATDDVVAFKRHLVTRERHQGGGTLSLSSVQHILHHLKGFFEWLRAREGYRRLDPDVPAFFSPSRRDKMTAVSPEARVGPTLETVEKVLSRMPQQSLAQRRDRAAIALILVTGVRDGALVSLRRKHLQFEQRRLIQDAHEVSTKFGKSQITSFFPISDFAEAIVADWLAEIDALGFASGNPLFPREVDRIRIPGGDGDLARESWATAAPLRASLKAACAAANVPYFFPHAIRKTIAVLGESRCGTVLELKAWSQNLGHKSISTTLESYGTLRAEQVDEALVSIRGRTPINDLVAKLESASAETLDLVRHCLIVGSRADSAAIKSS